MKKALFSCSLLLAISGLSYGMERAIKANHWQSVVGLLWEAKHITDTKKYIEILINSNTDLNTFAPNHASLLQELLLGASILNPQESPEIRMKCGHIRYTLKELIKHDKLNPELQWSGQLVADILDNTKKINNTRRYYTLLQTICDEVYEERKKDSTVFNTYEASLSNGLKRCKVTRSPLSLLIDRRVWATIAAIALLKGIHSWYTRRKTAEDLDAKNKADEEQEAQEQHNQA